MTNGTQKPASVGWLLFGFSGRASRKAFVLAHMLVIVMMVLILFKVLDVSPENIENGTLGFNIIAVLAVGQWINLALSAKRFRDFGKPGIFAAVMLIPMVALIALIALCFIPGDPGPNRYGQSTNAPA